MALLAVAVMFTGCSEDGYWDEYAEAGAKYSFAQKSQTFKLLASDVLTEVPVTIYRNTTEGAATLSVTGKFSEGLSGPAEVAFADGSNSATYVIAVGELAIGVPYTATLTIAEDAVSVSGSGSYTVTVQKSYTWTQVGVGDYTFGGYYWSGTQSGLPLYSCDQVEGYYKISNWAAAKGDLAFTCDADGVVYVDDQFTGAVNSSYGDVYICDFATYSGSESPYSYYADGVFNLAVIYYVSAGYFGYGMETFTLTEGGLN